jgi:uncharacterized protein YbjT (DUF2867 family)
MNVLVVGITTGLGDRLAELLLARGLHPVALVHRADQETALRARGMATVLVSPRVDPAFTAARRAIGEAGAMVLLTGSGAGSYTPSAPATASPLGQLMLAAEAARVPRFVMVSALLPGEAVRAALGQDLESYLAEKHDAERTLRERDLEWCVVRPGTLDDSPATGRITVRNGDDPRPAGGVSRSDLAETIYEMVVAPEPVRGVLAVSAGTVPIRAALSAVAGGPVRD